MRLLEYNSAGHISLAKNVDGNKLPAYAILSHTWEKMKVKLRSKIWQTVLVETSQAIRRFTSVERKPGAMAYDTFE